LTSTTSYQDMYDGQSEYCYRLGSFTSSPAQVLHLGNNTASKHEVELYEAKPAKKARLGMGRNGIFSRLLGVSQMPQASGVA
jgi:hypothetical protein